MYEMKEKTAVEEPPLNFYLFVVFLVEDKRFLFEITIYFVDFARIGEGSVVSFKQL